MSAIFYETIQSDTPKQDNSVATVINSPKSRSVSLFLAMHSTSISDWEEEKLGQHTH